MPLCFYVEKKLEVEKQLGDCEGLRYIFIRIAFYGQILYCTVHFNSALKIQSAVFFLFSLSLYAPRVYYLCSSWRKVRQTDTVTTANSTTSWLSWGQKIVS